MLSLTSKLRGLHKPVFILLINTPAQAHTLAESREGSSIYYQQATIASIELGIFGLLNKYINFFKDKLLIHLHDFLKLIVKF